MLIFKKEKAVIELIFRHIDKTAQCVHAMLDTVKSYVAGEISAPNTTDGAVNKLEREADDLLREIRDLLYSGAYLPQIRGDIYKLMSTVDDVCNKAEDCFDHFYYQFPVIPEAYASDIDAILDLTAECFAAFQKGLKAYFGPKDKLDKVRKHSLRVSEFESRIDAIDRKLTARIFKSSLEKGDKLHLRSCVRKIAAISDATEDAADQLQWLSVKTVL